MKDKIASKSLLNSCLLVSMACLPWATSASAQSSPGVFSKLNVGDGTGSTTGDGTLVAEGKHDTSPLLAPAYQTAGSRLLWYPKKSAFRAGYGNATTWNEVTMGPYSVAMGYNNKASGTGSTAIGYYMNTASGTGSTALGYYMNTASGAGSTAMGYYNTASGFASTAMGYYNTANGDGSTAMGSFTTASSFGEMVIGSHNALSSGNPWSWAPDDPVFQVGNGHWEVYESDLQIDLNGNGIVDQDWLEYLPETYSNAITVYKNGNMELQGNLTLGGTITSANSPVLTLTSAVANRFVQATTDGVLNITGGVNSNSWTTKIINGPANSASALSIASGYNTHATGAYSLAVGAHTKALNANSAAIGHGAETHGYESFALGRGTRAYGNLNFVGGWHSTASNYNSFVYGHGCHANSQSGGEGNNTDSFAIAMGSQSSANASHSVAIGYGANAEAHLSIAIGRSLNARTMYELNMGACAEISNPNQSWSETDALFRLGNSPDWNNRSDAITTLKNGQTTLINKAWSKRDIATVPATADPSTAATDSGGNALVVDGHTVLNGKVIISVPQGDISMGIYQ